MTRNYYVNGETMAFVKGRSDLAAVANLTELGITSEPIRIAVNTKRLDIRADPFGDGPPESQFMGAFAEVGMTLVHFDKDILTACLGEAWGSSPGFGIMGHAGALMGNGLPRFAPGGINGNHFLGLNLMSARGMPTWRFYHSCLGDSPMEFPIGTERSLVQMRWKALPYIVDPWNNGNGSYGVPIWDHGQD